MDIRRPISLLCIKVQKRVSFLRDNLKCENLTHDVLPEYDPWSPLWSDVLGVTPKVSRRGVSLFWLTEIQSRLCCFFRRTNAPQSTYVNEDHLCGGSGGSLVGPFDTHRDKMSTPSTPTLSSRRNCQSLVFRWVSLNRRLDSRRRWGPPDDKKTHQTLSPNRFTTVPPGPQYKSSRTEGGRSRWSRRVYSISSKNRLSVPAHHRVSFPSPSKLRDWDDKGWTPTNQYKEL